MVHVKEVGDFDNTIPVPHQQIQIQWDYCKMSVETERL